MVAVAIPTGRELIFRILRIERRAGLGADSPPIAFSRFVAVKLDTAVEKAAQLVGGDVYAKSFDHTAPRILGVASPQRSMYQEPNGSMQEVGASELRQFWRRRDQMLLNLRRHDPAGRSLRRLPPD